MIVQVRPRRRQTLREGIAVEQLPETILQFGGGSFLRAFADVFVHEANAAGVCVGRIVVVQSTEGNRATLLNAQGGKYHVVFRGTADGVEIDRTLAVRSISRALTAKSEWSEVLRVARLPALRMVISNTTEAGYSLIDNDDPETPLSFPARLLCVLKARYRAGLPGLSVLPCELVEPNGELLRELVLGQAEAWRLDAGLQDWIRRDVRWVNTLVDRIVSGRPEAHSLLTSDKLLTAAEPFALWVVEARAGDLFEHPCVRYVSDVRPYALRKVRILNGAHTALVCKAVPSGLRTVREAVGDPAVGPWLRRLVFEEIVPTLEHAVEDAGPFAEQVLERFANPFLDHRLEDIALHHEEKVKVRLMPTYEAFCEAFGRPPELLGKILAPYRNALRR